MLRTLDIENIAVIEKASVDFSPGLNVLTGETGAGKSIVIDSINAILGERTSKELVRHGCDNAYVSAYFDDIPETVSKKIAEIGYELDDNALLLSRKISTNGKSTCKINGKSATVSLLKEIGTLLVNIHGQHDSQALLNPDYQYQYIDMMFSDNSIFQAYKASFKDLITTRRKLKALAMSESDKDKELELLDYQIKELEDACIKIGEREELNQRRALISAAEAITNALNLSLQTINGDDENNGVQSSINICFNTLLQFGQAKEISEAFADINDKLEFAKDKIDALLLELNFDPNELEQIEERLDLLFRLSAKYGSDESEMLDFLEKAKQKRKSIVYSDMELAEL
ncbi:MAG: AAA family ATPase, partial [Eubacterium sp.]|nr:AAA family ATPase [Eubacterium sp.]